MAFLKYTIELDSETAQRWTSSRASIEEAGLEMKNYSVPYQERSYLPGEIEQQVYDAVDNCLGASLA